MEFEPQVSYMKDPPVRLRTAFVVDKEHPGVCV